PVWTLAAGTGTPGDGALLAGGFVLGTIPGAVLITILSQKLVNLMNPRRRQELRMACATLLIATGVLLIAYRGVFAPGFNWIGSGNETELRCHSPVLSIPVFR
ncbi:MAG: hypothetical protein KDK34_12760, partial [Leptospiraceae bacterium]|nr:hypothetical protein [Leptospiraceae bacterium]